MSGGKGGGEGGLYSYIWEFFLCRLCVYMFIKASLISSSVLVGP